MTSITSFYYYWIFRCASSSLNGEELVRDGGIQLVATLLCRCMFVVQPTTPASEPSAIIVTNVMRTFSVLSRFESARAEMLQFSGLVEDIVHCTELELVPEAVDAALQTIAHVSVSSELQDALLRAGVLWYVISFIFLNYCFAFQVHTHTHLTLLQLDWIFIFTCWHPLIYKFLELYYLILFLLYPFS